MPTLYQTLQHSPYAQVKFPIACKQLEGAIDAFFQFLSLPDEIKTHIDLRVSQTQRRAEIGYRHRDPEDDPYHDSKDFFHFHPMIFEKYESFLEKNPIVQDFMFKAKPIWDGVYAVTYKALNSLNERFPGTTNKIFGTKDVHILLRFLKYQWNESGEYLAKPHFDAGSFTLAVAESCPGLRIGYGPDDLEIVNHKENHAIFMVSSNFKKIIDSDEFAPGWHDVIQMDKTKVGKSFARWAMVAFIDGINVEQLPREETHKYV